MPALYATATFNSNLNYYLFDKAAILAHLSSVYMFFCCHSECGYQYLHL